MRYIILLVLLASLSTASAQCVLSDLEKNTINSNGAVIGMDISGASVFSLLEPRNNFSYPLLTEFVVTKASMNGVVDWHRRVIPTNQGFKIRGAGLHATNDGGAVIYGDLHHPTYSNLFAVKLDANGEVDWARIYMVHDGGGAGVDHGGRRGFTELASGGYGWVFNYHYTSLYYFVRLDQNGVPTSVRSIIDQNLQGNQWISNSLQCAVGNDGSLFLTFTGYDANNTRSHTSVRLDSSGQLDWAITIPGNNISSLRSVTGASNGDHILAMNASTSLIRLNGLGEVSWARSMTSGKGDVFELSNGDLMLVNTYPAGLSRITAGGVGIERWSLPSQALKATGSDGDNFGMWLNSSGTFLMTPDPASLGSGCNVLPDGIENPSAYTQFIVPNSNVQVTPDSIKTWTMGINDPNVPFLDLKSTIVSGGIRPGFTSTFHAQVQNGSLAMSGPITAKFVLDAELTMLSATPAPSSTSGDTLIWTGLASLDVYEAHQLTVEASLPADTTLIGTTVSCWFSALQDSVEFNDANNVVTYDRIVTASFDPNDKLVSPEGIFDPFADSLLNYTIRFQNTGTDTAFTVVLVDTLPEHVSLGSFKSGPSSHPYTYQLNAQGILTFTFDNILLPDSNVNQAASHGLVSFSLRPDENLAIGTLISNSADIYFDFNPPVRTPPADVLYGLVTGIPLKFKTEQVLVYPVPVQHALTALLPEDFRAETLTLTSLDGRLVATNSVQQVTNKLLIPVEQLAAGAYVLTLIDSDGKRLGARFVKE